MRFKIKVQILDVEPMLSDVEPMLIPYLFLVIKIIFAF